MNGNLIEDGAPQFKLHKALAREDHSGTCTAIYDRSLVAFAPVVA